MLLSICQLKKLNIKTQRPHLSLLSLYSVNRTASHWNLLCYRNFFHSAKSFQLWPTLRALWTIAHQAPLSMGFSWQKYWSWFPCPTPGDLPYQGTNLCLLCLLHWQVGSLPVAPLGNPFFAHSALKLRASRWLRW